MSDSECAVTNLANSLLKMRDYDKLSVDELKEIERQFRLLRMIKEKSQDPNNRSKHKVNVQSKNDS